MHQVGFLLHRFIKRHGQKNIKYLLLICMSIFLAFLLHRVYWRTSKRTFVLYVACMRTHLTKSDLSSVILLRWYLPVVFLSKECLFLLYDKHNHTLCILIAGSLCNLIVVYVRVFLLFVHVFLTLSMYSYCCLCILTLVYVFLLFVHVFSLLSMYSYCCLCILIVVFVFLLFVHVFLTLSIHSYCCLCILRRGYPDWGFSVLFPRL